MTLEEYDVEIERIRSLISQKTASANYYKQQGQSWIDDAEKTKNCKGTKKQKDACIAENNRKRNYGQGLIAQGNAIQQEVNSLTVQLNNLISARDKETVTANEVSLILANQGKTESYLDRLAKSESEAQMITAQAQAQAIAKDADATASNKKKIGLLLAGVGLVIILVVGVIIYKKYKK